MGSRAYYSDTIEGFRNTNEDVVFATLCKDKSFPTNSQTKKSWDEEIKLLHASIPEGMTGQILLEFNIPRMGHRVDTVLLTNGVVILLEFKMVEGQISSSAAKRQVLDYGLDLADFHSDTQGRIVLPLAVISGLSTSETIKANVAESFIFPSSNSKVADPVAIGDDDLSLALESILSRFHEPDFDYANWEEADYRPSPSIIEYERELYKKHNVQDILRKGAGEDDISATTKAVMKVIEDCRKEEKKALVFVAGVPGAGKTLIGLNLSNELGSKGIFLSGNGPLVTVLKTALVRDTISREEREIKEARGERARRGVKALVQDAYDFRNDTVVANQNPPVPKRSPENVIVFDEAQRAWDEPTVETYMAEKKDVHGLKMSEPEFMLKSLDQHDDWAVMVCLVGGGQDIHKGETGLVEWIETVKRKFGDWSIYTSDKLNNTQYIKDRNWDELVGDLDVHYDPSLYLSASMRSFKNENVSSFVNCLLDGSVEKAATVYDDQLRSQYPIAVSRDLEMAKAWVQAQTRGSQRCGLLVHSLAERMAAFGVYYDKNRIQVSDWFINGPEDVRSSYRMEIPASEFETQGLEVEYAIVCWDADLRRNGNKWSYYRFGIPGRGMAPNWIQMSFDGNEDENSTIVHLINSYRVLLTRARQGMVIYVPRGIEDDPTVNPVWYDSIYEYLHDQIGIKDVSKK